MDRALQAWLHAAHTGATPEQAATAAAEAVASDPWAVVTQAGALARARIAVAPHDLGLTPALRPCEPGRGIATVPQGAPYPVADHKGQQARGAFDTPREMARKLVHLALDATPLAPRTGLDPACGTGALLVALAERGLSPQGIELDPVAAAVARVAAPTARVDVADALAQQTDLRADVVVANPPFVAPERQDKIARRRLARRYDFLRGRFDLCTAFAGALAQEAPRGAGVALVVPASLLAQPYGIGVRRLWLLQHRITALQGPLPFAGVSSRVALVALQAHGEPSTLPNGMAPGDLLNLLAVPLSPDLRPGDLAIARAIRARSVPLGELCEVDTGVVSHGPDGGKARLLHDAPGPGRVPYADANDLLRNRRRWLHYQPERMHRPKRPELFRGPKILVQRLRGQGPVRAWLDESDLYAGHTLTVVRPLGDRVPLRRLHDLLTSPLVNGLLRIEHGERLDLYPKDVRTLPVPCAWLSHPELALPRAWHLDPGQARRLGVLSRV